MKEFSQIIARVKQQMNLDAIEILVDFKSDRVWVNKDEQNPTEFLQSKELINFVIGMRYGISNIKVLYMTDTEVIVYYEKDNQDFKRKL